MEILGTAVHNLTRQQLISLAAERILVLDGAMGSLIQTHDLDEADFRGELLVDHPSDLQGNNDLLNLTRPDVIASIHRQYLQAGADIITTNTFNGTAVAQAEYGTAHLVREINLAAAKLARQAADEFTKTDPVRPRFVAGSLAPTNRTCSISPDVNDPGRRNITFRELVVAYGEEAAALLDGGVDILMIETVFDPLNAKAAVFAIGEILRKRRLFDFPVWISGTITDASGRTLTGQTPEAFWISLQHAEPAVFGLNCALGAEAMKPHVADLARVCDTLVSAHPNAGLPNELGGYDETPEQTAQWLADFAAAGLVNIVGGCCGTTPDHIRAIAEAVQGRVPRTVPMPRIGTCLAGLEPLVITEDSLFVNIGERTNVAGSRRFARLIREEQFEEALEVGRQQVRGGAQIVDVNMDDALLDAPEAMATFLNVLASDPEVSRVPVMIDSSDWDVIEAGLQCVQGKPVVNSLSLKDGETEFRRRARLARRYGAAVIVMAFDEQGQADTLDRRLAICGRAWKVLVEEEGFPAQDIIFDPNVFAVATGMTEHDRYATDFLAACTQIKERFPGALCSGGISNLSFSFRGNDTVREAMHAVFLYHAIAAGLDLGIVNAGQLAVYEEIEPELREAVGDVILNRRSDATERLVAIAARTEGQSSQQVQDLTWRDRPVAERLAHALLTGEAEFIAEDTRAALAETGDALAVIEGFLMVGMNQVGKLFGAGKMFLPQVIRSARVMKKAVAVLEPHLQGRQAGTGAGSGTILLATVKGDVHDIGKNIVGVVLGCNGYRVVDLGVMVPAEKILQVAQAEQADIIGLSGLITPSLTEMVKVAESMRAAGLTVPLLIGGATTSRLHTAVKIAPAYPSGVFYVPDASQAASMAGSLLGSEAAATRAKVAQDYERLRLRREEEGQSRKLLSLAEARSRSLHLDWSAYVPPVPRQPGIRVWGDVDPALLRPYIDWTPFFHAWKLPGKYPGILEDPEVGVEARKLLADAESVLDELIREHSIRAAAVVGLFPAAVRGDDLLVYANNDRRQVLGTVPFLRQQRPSASGRPNLSLVDFIAPEESGPPDWVGAFVVTAGLGARQVAERWQQAGDDYRSILVKALADRLAEAFAEHMHQQVRREIWGYASAEDLNNDQLIAEEYQGIRPAPGYPACPDHLGKLHIFALLDAERNCGVSLTENGAMEPAATVAGYFFSHPQARYFGVGRIGPDQLADYADRSGLTVDVATRWLAGHLF